MIYSISCVKRGILEVKDGTVDTAAHKANACGDRQDAPLEAGFALSCPRL